eukprot:COSAG01_NODE_20941_length_926_cov_3.288996_1_plen_84_part_00
MYSLGPPIAPPRCSRHERVGVASLERKGDGEHEVFLRVGASPHARLVVSVGVIAATHLTNITGDQIRINPKYGKPWNETMFFN